jgi:hypothetical protein
MPTLDNIDITLVQRGDQSRGMVIRPSGTTGGHGRGGGLPAGRGGIPASGILAGSRSGTPAGGRGGGAAVGSSTTPAPGKGKQARVILDDDEASSDKDEPLQKRLWQLSSAGPAVLDEAAVPMTTVDKEATDKRATMKRAAKERVAEEATMKAVADEEVPSKTADEAARATGGSLAPGQAPSVAGAKSAAAPPRQPNIPTGVFGNLGLSNFLSSLFFLARLHFLITLFAQVLFLRRGHRDGHNYFCRRHRCHRCGYQGDSRVGSRR